jgi:GNAT superfamily N-acetyltransferase
MTGITVAAASGFGDVQALLEAFLDTTGENAPDAASSARIADAMARGDIRFFVARDAGKPVGLISLTTGFSTYRAGPFGLLEDLFVAPDRRGRGVGRRLIEAATDQARRAGCRSLLAGCGAGDVSMWEHLGFRPIGTLVSRDL